MKTIIKNSVIAIFAIILLISCNNKDTNKDVINIGVIAPLTGDGSRYGEAMKRGIDFAIEDLNRVGGFQKKKIVAIYADDKFNTKDAINGYKYLENISKVPIIFGPAGSGISKALAPFAEKDKIVLFSSISTSDTLTYAGDYYFRNISKNSLEAKSISDLLLKKLNLKNVGVFYENNEYGININQEFKSYFKGNIVFNLPYEFKQTDFRSSIASVKDKKFDAIFIQGTTKCIALITKQLRESGINCPIMTGDGGYGDEIKQIAGKTANGLYCTLPAVENENNDTYKKFKERYLNKYKEQPDIYAVFSYDAVMMVFNAIKNEKEGIITGELIKDKLYKTPYIGLSGKYEFDSNGDVNKPFFIFQYNDGEYKQLK